MKSFSEFKAAMRNKNHKPFALDTELSDPDFEALASGAIERLITTRGSQHCKTTNADMFAAYLIGLNPNVRIIIASYAARATRKHSRQIVRYLQSPAFTEFFGWKVDFTKKTEDDIQVEWVNQEGGCTLLMRSVESPALGEAADFLLIDDPLAGGLKGASPLKIDRATDAIENVLMQRLAPANRVLIIATLWTEGDPPLRLWEKWKTSGVAAVYTNLATLNEDGRCSWRWDAREPEPRFFHAYPVLWPEYRNLEFIQRKQREMDLPEFETQYQGRPMGGTGSVAESAWKYYDNLPNDLWCGLIAVDTGSERGEANDPTYMMGVGYGPNGLFILDAVQGRWNIDEMSDQFLALYRRVALMLGTRQPAEFIYKIPLSVIEKAALGRALHDELIKKLPPMLVQMCSPEGKPKEIRAREQLHHIVNGKVFLPRHAGFSKEIVRQWYVFPRGGAHDEAVDCLTYALRHAENCARAYEAVCAIYPRTEVLGPSGGGSSGSGGSGMLSQIINSILGAGGSEEDVQEAIQTLRGGIMDDTLQSSGEANEQRLATITQGWGSEDE